MPLPAMPSALQARLSPASWGAAGLRLLAALVASGLLLSTASFERIAPRADISGTWEPAGAGGTPMRLSIGGRLSGPFTITWTGSVLSQCPDGAGLLRGLGWLDAWNSRLVEATLQAECPDGRQGPSVQLTLGIDPALQSLTMTRQGKVIQVWRRSDLPQAGPPELELRVNYGEDWIEAFYEEGHTVWAMVMEPDGVTPKAQLRAVTEDKPFWSGSPGFSSLDSGWLDLEGTPTRDRPDIQPNDWVVGWVDNGANDGVQIGRINGTLDVASDSISGTVLAPWFSDLVTVQCLDWGSIGLQPYGSREAGHVAANGRDSYSCSWSGEWDVRGGQAVGVGYTGPDRGWVSNLFRSPYFTVLAEQRTLEGWGWSEGAAVTASVVGKPECSRTGRAAYSQQDQSMTSFSVYFPQSCNLQPGDLLTVGDGTTSMTHKIRDLAITLADADRDTVLGTAEPGAIVHAWVHGHGESEMEVREQGGGWQADFRSLPFDVQGGMCGRAETRDAEGNITAADWCLPVP